MTENEQRPKSRKSLGDGLTLLDYRNGWMEVVNDDGVQIAQAMRYYACDGAEFTGWIVSWGMGGREHSDPISRKAEAETTLISVCTPENRRLVEAEAASVVEIEARMRAAGGVRE